MFFKFGFEVIFEMEKTGKNRKLSCGGKGEDGKNWKIESLVDSIRIGRTSCEKVNVEEKG